VSARTTETELLLLLLGLRVRRLLVGDGLRAAPALEDDARVDAQEEGDDDAQHRKPAPDRHPAAPEAAPILDIVALAPSLPFHAVGLLG
jgi:hypothetical protein